MSGDVVLARSGSFLRLHDQLHYLWRSRDKEQTFVRGLLISRARDPPVERWFTLLGHAIFFCTRRDCPEYTGALLTDIFNPVIPRVDDNTVAKFLSSGATSEQQVDLRTCTATSMH